ncbi:DNA/RNA-binding domain, Est1-type,PIN domain,PIN domain-like,Tetratricopeptide-like helical [Cinara cedri]|uniref:DNA/RNA-binding domain, Est1-type,PIN domain,PIN domain-like,Tetratricopeptide-like helical n=1 Tax=Cinara cedri TaxID=506608 RepID=A0A5E4MI97_9HEMI|nr:DNA/RNA-binding domain, Est1-type,PIN domain,PIN domain-like,Tetratricopeptide-like helical [Cinara cedri]
MAKLDEDLSRLSIDDDANNKFGKRDKLSRDLEIYRPGSGPLRRSGNTRQDGDEDDKRSLFTGFGRDLESSKKSDFIPNKHFENPSRKKENFPRGPSKVMNGFPADNYSTFNLRRKQQKKTQPFYEPSNEWTNEKRQDRPRVNFVNPDDSKGDDENWRAHKAPKVVSVPKVVKKIEEKPVTEKVIPQEIIHSMVIKASVNTITVHNIPDKVVASNNRKLEEKKAPAKTIPSNILMSYEKRPPRLRKKFCEENHITVEEVESYLTNGLVTQDDHNKPHGLYQSRSQTLPPRSGKSRFNEPQRHQEQTFYRTNSNQLPPKTEVKKVPLVVNSSTESSRRGIDFDVTTKMYNNSNQESKTDYNSRDDIEDNTSVNMKQSIESAVLLPSGTINWAEEVERAENMSKVAEDTKKEVERLENVEKTQSLSRDRKQRKSISKDRNLISTIPVHDQHSNTNHSNWHSKSNDNPESSNSNVASWRKEKPNRNRSNDRIRNHSKNRRHRNNSEKSILQPKSENIGGIIKLPPNVNVNADSVSSLSLSGYLKQSTMTTAPHPCPAKQLFNPHNPKQPIVVSTKQQIARAGYTPVNIEPYHTSKDLYPINVISSNTQQYSGAHFGNPPPAWYDPYTESYRLSNHPVLLLDIRKADSIMETLVFGSNMLQNWVIINSCREFLKDSLRELLKSDMKFCQRENIETHFWKILYHNIIEQLKKLINEDKKELVNDYTMLLTNLIEEGMKYMNDLLKFLEKQYNFNLDDYVSLTCLSTKKLGNIGLALISSQKLYISLGDLARYKDVMNNSTNYVIAKQWYTKANQINPKNGRPYNQLALLAVYEKRKLDAVYYYMRSLMASNPFQSAKDSLLTLFEEYRRKYEMTDRKRQEDRERREREKAKEKESSMSSKEKYSKRRKEIWIHPDGGKRSHRTTSTTEPTQDIDEEELSKLSQSEINKRFIVSFLHVHGKLFTKVGMESFQDTALQMLREFRSLLSYSPLPIITIRFLQYLALNMFAIENSRPKETHVEQGYWSTVHECALVMSLQMFSLIVDRCNQLLKEMLVKDDGTSSKHLIGSDIDFLLPPIKIWCDWLLCNSKVWNPPPSCSDYKISGTGDCWSRLASLVNNLEKFQEHYKLFLNESDESDPSMRQQLKLPEDSMFSGFTPIIGYELKPTFIKTTSDRVLSELAYRVNCILFFGTEFLCGTEPPVFKLHKTDTGANEYISVVETASPKDDSEDEDICFESWSDEENESKSKQSEDKSISNVNVKPISNEIQKLLSRKEELEQKQRNEELRQKRVQEILKQASFCTEIEIKPHYVVPDTNCFIDYLPQLEQLIYSFSHAQEHTCTLMVPTVVLIELEGLAKGGWVREIVCEAAKQALKILKNIDTAAVKFVTTKGSSFKSTTFFEEENNFVGTNDDKILATCLSLCKNNSQLPVDNPQVEGEPIKIYRDVVLLTEDRNLRVKALSSDVPVRAIMDFISWFNFKSS